MKIHSKAILTLSQLLLMGMLGGAFGLSSGARAEDAQCSSSGGGACHKSCYIRFCSACLPCGADGCTLCQVTATTPPPYVCNRVDCTTAGPIYCTEGGDQGANNFHCTT